ncbi:Hypothetical protein PBC10988_38570 [Planctomycetales bacterium 10988]|nr:Hypothetical protein PBC10988_38570 [Planctomycetales bacterium 10988]
MHSAIGPLLATAMLGIDVGWQPNEEGVMEYIIQVEPEIIPTLEKGQDLTGSIPADLPPIRLFRVTLGDGPVIREVPTQENSDPETHTTAKPLSPQPKIPQQTLMKPSLDRSMLPPAIPDPLKLSKEGKSLETPIQKWEYTPEPKSEESSKETEETATSEVSQETESGEVENPSVSADMLGDLQAKTSNFLHWTMESPSRIGTVGVIGLSLFGNLLLGVTVLGQRRILRLRKQES